MVVVKRQRREKPAKIEQRKVRGPECRPDVTQTPFLASPIYIGQAQREEKKIYKRRRKGASLLLLSFGSTCPQGLFSFAF